MEQERRGDQRRDFVHLHDSGGDDDGQQRKIHRRGEQQRRQRDEQCGDTYCERIVASSQFQLFLVGFRQCDHVPNSSTQSVTLTNAGNSSVTISNVTVSGAGFNASGVSSGLILTPGQTATLTATFAPAAAGSVTGSVSVASNATNSPDSIALSGTGVAAVNHSVALTWTPSTSTVIGYNTYSSAKSGGPYTKMTGTPVAATSYTDSSVQAGQTYYFVVTSVDSSNVESAYSAEVSALIP